MVNYCVMIIVTIARVYVVISLSHIANVVIEYWISMYSYTIQIATHMYMYVYTYTQVSKKREMCRHVLTYK